MLKTLGFIFLLALIVGGIGWFAGWIEFDAAHAHNSSSVGVTVDKQRVERDLERLGREAKDVVNGSEEPAPLPEHLKAQLAAADEVLRGQVDTVARDQLKVQDGGKLVAVELQLETPIYRNGDPASRSDLRVDDRVTVAFDERSGTRTVLFVSAAGD
ncbi:MAG: hypothetical protein ACE37K_18335 [Planctomycetota bacterium]|jgi:hypothetical protein